jgi:hypothetical protein
MTMPDWRSCCFTAHAAHRVINGRANLGLTQRKRDPLTRELRLLHQQNPPPKSASVLPDISHSQWIHLPGQGQF